MMKSIETTVDVGRGSLPTAVAHRVVKVAVAGLLAATSGTTSGCASFDEQALTLGPAAEGSEDAALGPLPTAGSKKPTCRAARVGELVINEVVTRPGDRDLDGDGLANGRDELVELVSQVEEPVHIENVRVLYNHGLRGHIRKSPCIAPHTAVVLVGHTTGHFSPPPGAVRISVDRSLRLTDGGGRLALVDAKGQIVCQAEVPAAKTIESGCVNRAWDGDELAPLLPHALIDAAGGSSWSPGTCANGQQYPACVVYATGPKKTQDAKADDIDEQPDGGPGASSG